MLKRNIADGKIRALVQGRNRHHGLAASEERFNIHSG